VPENTAEFDIPKPLDADSPPSLETSVGPAFDRIDELFAAIDLSQLVVPGSSDGKILIVKDGAAAYKAMSGDGTIDEDGVFQIGAGAVGTPELASKAATTAKIDDGAITEANLAAAIAQALIPVGTVLGTSLSAAATGFLMGEGQAVSRATYAALFAKYNAMGLPYGAGDGSTTFNMPDYRGRALVGKGTHADVNALTDSDGLSVGSRTPKHVHEKGSLGTGGPSSGVGDAAGGGLYGLADNLHSHTVTGGTASAGPAYAVVNYMVKT
jgi:Phage Tail Collar Domain